MGSVSGVIAIIVSVGMLSEGWTVDGVVVPVLTGVSEIEQALIHRIRIIKRRKYKGFCI